MADAITIECERLALPPQQRSMILCLRLDIDLQHATRRCRLTEERGAGRNGERHLADDGSLAGPGCCRQDRKLASVHQAFDQGDLWRTLEREARCEVPDNNLDV